MLRARVARPWALVDGGELHLRHQSSYPPTPDRVAEPLKVAGHLAAAIPGIIEERGVDHAHRRERLGRLRHPRIVERRPADRYKAALRRDRQAGMPRSIIFGLPRSAIRSINSRTTRLPEIDVSSTARKHSRVTSSTMLRMRNRRSLVIWSWTKSTLQRWLGSANTGAGGRAPTARLCPFRRRTVRLSSR
jgi:hypothetical protein